MKKHGYLLTVTKVASLAVFCQLSNLAMAKKKKKLKSRLPQTIRTQNTGS